MNGQRALTDSVKCGPIEPRIQRTASSHPAAASCSVSYLLGRPTLLGKALSFTHELYLFLFYQSTVLSRRAVVGGHQMYFGGSVVSKASTISIDISPTPPLILTGSQKVRNLASFSTSLNFEPPAFKNAAKISEF